MLTDDSFEQVDVPQRVGGDCRFNVDDAIGVPLLDGNKTIGALALFQSPWVSTIVITVQTSSLPF